jgi:DNA ligase-associated metallophosphoesterase
LSALTPIRTAAPSDPGSSPGRALPLSGGGIRVCGTSFHADCLGALYWPEESLLVVADLHLEKGSSFARRGSLLPPYDTAETLSRLARLIAHYAPRSVIALGDNFHDGGGPARLSAQDRASLVALQRGRDWVWIAGNHDPDPAENIGGSFAATISIGALTFRHLPSRDAPEGEIAGHLHPVARVAQRGRAVSRRCFATDGKALVMPAFGAYTGGLNIRDRAFVNVFGARKFTAHMLGDHKLYAFAAARCLGD